MADIKNGEGSERPVQLRRRKDGPAKRKCLKCGAKFNSTGTFNRLCPKDRHAGIAVYDTVALLTRTRGARYG